MKNKFSVILTFIFGVVIALSGVYIYGLFFSFKEDIGKLKKDYRNINNEYNSLKKENKKIREENILAEAENKKLMKDKSELNKNNLMLEEENKKINYKLLESKDTIEKLKKSNNNLVSDVNDRIKKILEDRKSLTNEIKNLKAQVADYRRKVEIQENLPDDVTDLKNKYIILQAQKNRIQDESTECATKMAVLTEKANRFEVENSTYKDTISRSNNLIDVLQKERGGFKNKYEKAAANLGVVKKTIIELNAQNKKLTSENKYLKNRIARVPQSMAELAQLKKQLIKEKTLFHYNLGVFYTQKGDYKKAAESFNKVIAINPQDADAQYNLGVIYSEYLNDKKKATKHFKTYLSLAPSDPDSDKARKYLLLQESIEGHK